MNIEDVQQHLPDFAFDEDPDFASPIDQYFRFYGLDFERTMAGLRHSFGLIEAADYQIACHYYQWQEQAAVTTGQSKGCILIVHGLYDHSGLYNHLIENCLQQGFDVLAFDLPGHGLSSGRRVSIASFEEYQRVLKQVTAYFSSHANITALIGQSTGAAIVMNYLFDYPEANVKAVLLAPLLQPYGWEKTLWLYSLLKTFVKRVPRFFANNSHDKAFVSFLKHNDPLQYRYTHLDWVGALKEWVENFKYFKANKSDVLIVQGSQDDTVDWRHNLPRIQKKLPRATIVNIDGAGHHLVKETEKLRGECFRSLNMYLNK